jgi:hypothetical protein
LLLAEEEEEQQQQQQEEDVLVVVVGEPSIQEGKQRRFFSFPAGRVEAWRLGLEEQKEEEEEKEEVASCIVMKKEVWKGRLVRLEGRPCLLLPA